MPVCAGGAAQSETTSNCPGATWANSSRTTQKWGREERRSSLPRASRKLTSAFLCCPESTSRGTHRLRPGRGITRVARARIWLQPWDAFLVQLREVGKNGGSGGAGRPSRPGFPNKLSTTAAPIRGQANSPNPPRAPFPLPSRHATFAHVAFEAPRAPNGATKSTGAQRSQSPSDARIADHRYCEISGANAPRRARETPWCYVVEVSQFAHSQPGRPRSEWHLLTEHLEATGWPAEAFA